jgi:site-specific recombinase XerD
MNPVQSVSKQHFFQYMDEFIDYRTTIYETSEQTNKSNLIDLALFKDFLDMKQYDFIDGRAVMDFQYYLKKQRLNCGASMNRKLFTLRSYSNYLKLESIPFVDNLPFADVLKCRQGYKTKPAALSEKQTKALLGSIDRTTFMGLRDYAVYALMYLLGLRVGEVHNLDIEDIDFDKKEITVTGKGNKIRSIPLEKEILTILAFWLVVRKHFRNHHICKSLFLSKKGSRLAIRTMEDNLQKIIKRSKLLFNIHVTCHTLRHSFASYLNEKGVYVLVIQNLLGHSSPRTTSNYYIHPSLQKVREALEKLPGVLYLKELEKAGLLNFQAAYEQRE